MSTENYETTILLARKHWLMSELELARQAILASSMSDGDAFYLATRHHVYDEDQDRWLSFISSCFTKN